MGHFINRLDECFASKDETPLEHIFRTVFYNEEPEVVFETIELYKDKISWAFLMEFIHNWRVDASTYFKFYKQFYIYIETSKGSPEKIDNELFFHDKIRYTPQVIEEFYEHIPSRTIVDNIFMTYDMFGLYLNLLCLKKFGTYFENINIDYVLKQETQEEIPSDKSIYWVVRNLNIIKFLVEPKPIMCKLFETHMKYRYWNIYTSFSGAVFMSHDFIHKYEDLIDWDMLRFNPNFENYMKSEYIKTMYLMKQL